MHIALAGPRAINEAEQKGGLRMMALKASMPPCPTRKIWYGPIMMPGDGWAFEHVHEDHCPEHEDNQPAHEVQIVGLVDLAVHAHAEAIWEDCADEHDDDTSEGWGRGRT